MRVRAALLVSVLSASGCSCTDSPSPDAAVPRDAHGDALVVPDAGPPFALIEHDVSPCPAVEIAPQRPRALPADATPRLLWTASLTELGIVGMIPEQGAVDRAGDVHFSAVLFEHRGAEIDREGALLGFGDGLMRNDAGRFGPMVILPDDRAMEATGDFLRIDASPPSVSERNLVSFPVPTPTSSGPFLATTSDGFYAMRTQDSLRKYCADGRLQWEIPIEAATSIRTEPDDSVWLFGSSNTESTAVRIDSTGQVIEEQSNPDGVIASSPVFAGSLRFSAGLTVDGGSLVLVRRDAEREVFRLTGPVATSGVRVTPVGDVWWREERDGDGIGTWTRFEDGVATSDVAEMSLSGRTAFGDDGSMLVVWFTDEDGPQLICMDRHGRIRWRVSFPYGALFWVHDVDGRVYLFGGQHVMAVQTDVLPPAVRGCWQVRCNYLANNRLEEVHD